MHSNLIIGPSFQSGSIGVNIVRELNQSKPVYTGTKIYPINKEQDYDMVMLIGRAFQESRNSNKTWVTKLFDYINNLQLKDSNGKILKLNPTNPDGYSISAGGTHAVVVKEGLSKVGDVNLDLYSEILS